MHFRNPVKGENEPHHGPVQAVSCSPFHRHGFSLYFHLEGGDGNILTHYGGEMKLHRRNIFATCATDSTVRLYSLMATKPITMCESERN